LDSQDKSVSNIVPIIESLDPYALNSLFQSAISCKSAAIALALLWKDGTGIATAESEARLTLEEAVSIARVDERH
jgi:chaperone required for assembly of F1-ATPase